MGCPYQGLWVPKITSPFIFPLYCKTDLFRECNFSKKTLRGAGQSWCKSAYHGDGKNPTLPSELRPEVAVNSLQNSPPTEA